MSVSMRDIGVLFFFLVCYFYCVCVYVMSMSGFDVRVMLSSKIEEKQFLVLFSETLCKIGVISSS